ncbi:MAG: hypothetical protein FWF49_03420 [Oscillospiraceae bacterium]|nr:hypothetical protein [Oscillospiraceae bacterium]
MIYYAPGSEQRQRLTVPRLDGGLNLRDAPQHIGDNQLTDAVNVHWRTGALRTRPGFTRVATLMQQELYDYIPDTRDRACQSDLASLQNRRYVLLRSKFADHLSVGLQFFDPLDADVPLPLLFFENPNAPADESVMLLSAPDQPWGVVLFTGAGDMVSFPADGSGTCADLTTQCYAPLCWVNVNYHGMGTSFEGRNLLTTRYRASFTTQANDWQFHMPTLALDDGEIRITLQGAGDLFIPAGQGHSTASLTVAGTEFYGWTDRKNGWVRFYKSADDNAFYMPAFDQSNNLTIEASCGDNHKLTVTKCLHNTWFGNDRSGATGGTRAFVAGNPDEQHLVRWSDLNNPLYFPENNYAYVGEAGSPVTGFAKQDNMLVIFKQREMYCTTYVQGTYTSDQVLSGEVPDVTALSAVFPVTLLSSEIGCESIRTVGVCDQRLTWFYRGQVFTLQSATATSGARMLNIGDVIAPALAACTPQYAAVFDDTYALLAGDTLWLWQFGAGGIWTKWTLPAGLTGVWMVTIDGVPCLFVSDGLMLHRYGLGGTCDDLPNGSTAPIEAAVQTKAFDFGAPDKKKCISRLYIGLEAPEDTAVRYVYLTDMGEDDYTAGGTEAQWVSPALNRLHQFSLRIESAGMMAMDGIVMNLRLFAGGIQ